MLHSKALTSYGLSPMQREFADLYSSRDRKRIDSLTIPHLWEVFDDLIANEGAVARKIISWIQH
ncbi:MAG: hypothetical protein WCG27_03255 [Pseudomonadota bacterium]